MLYDMIEAVLVRPTMYTISGSLGECIAFLQGYSSGLAKASYDPSLAEQLDSFKDWLAQELSLPTRYTFHEFTKHKGDNDDAVKLFLEYYRKFKDQTPKLDK